MNQGVLWVKKVLKICNSLMEYTEEEKNIVFADVNGEYLHFDSKIQAEIKEILLSKMDLEVAMTVISVLIENGAADQWIPFYIQIAENLMLDNKLHSSIELQMNTVEYSDDTALRDYHKRNIMRWKEQISIHATWKPVEKRNPGRIVIITEQLLSDLHAPTKAVLDLAYMMQHRMGFEVLLVSIPINSSGLDEIWHNAIRMSAVEKYNTEVIDRKYKDESFFGYQITMAEGNNRDYSLLLSYLLEWNPLLVYNFGVINPIADLLVEYTTVAAQSMSIRLPISEAQMLITLQEKEKIEISAAQRIIQFKRRPLFFGDQKRIHTREEYGIQKNQFVCVIVGNRLETEIDEAFVEMVCGLSSEREDIAFLFIGKTGVKAEEFKGKISNRQVYFLDFCDDLLGIYKIMDLYVNPKRQGGGYSAAMAIAAGLPVVTCDYGDVAYHVGQDFIVSDYEEMKQEILCCASNPVYKKQKFDQAAERAERMTEDNMLQIMEDNMKKLINEVMSAGK